MHKTLLQLLISFEWDDFNQHKSWKKHGISKQEAEQIFMCSPLLILDDERHSYYEARYHALGKTQENKKLFISFTVRANKVRIISARAMSRTERRIYEIKETEADSKI
ncbi:MAG: BrnT family toxin [Pseudomonadota bacterium]